MSHLVPSINYEICCGEMGVLVNRKKRMYSDKRKAFHMKIPTMLYTIWGLWACFGSPSCLMQRGRLGGVFGGVQKMQCVISRLARLTLIFPLQRSAHYWLYLYKTSQPYRTEFLLRPSVRPSRFLPIQLRSILCVFSTGEPCKDRLILTAIPCRENPNSEHFF